MCLASPCLSLYYSDLSHRVFLEKVLWRKRIERNRGFLEVQRGTETMGISQKRNPVLSPFTQLEAWFIQRYVYLSEKRPQTWQFCETIRMVFLSPLLHNFPFSLDGYCCSMEGKWSFLCTECKLPLLGVCSLRTVFGWTLQSSLKGEPFPTVLWESCPFEVTAGLTKLISSLHNVPLMQCWLRLPLAGSCHWTRPKCNV